LATRVKKTQIATERMDLFVIWAHVNVRRIHFSMENTAVIRGIRYIFIS